MSESTRSQIENLEKQMAQIKARLVSENAKIRQVEIKRKIRRMILAGAFIFEEYKGREKDGFIFNKKS